MRMTRRLWVCLLFAAALVSGGVGPATSQGKDTLVFAAASLKNALDEIAGQWQRQTGKNVAISYAASNKLIKQIEQGAPADIFFSADTDLMDYGQQKNLIKPDTRTNLLGNRIVLIAPKDSTVSMDIRPAISFLRSGSLEAYVRKSFSMLQGT
jgi:molybdate transport system substrate-binding protein